MRRTLLLGELLASELAMVWHDARPIVSVITLVQETANDGGEGGDDEIGAAALQEDVAGCHLEQEQERHEQCTRREEERERGTWKATPSSVVVYSWMSSTLKDANTASRSP